MVVVDNHTLTIGVRKNETIDGDWAIFDDFTLTYYGNGDDAYQLWDNNVTTGLSEEIPHTVNMMQNTQAPSYYTLDGKSVKVPRQRGLYLQKDANGFVRKFLHDE
jgi:hypothetical protein